MSQDAEFETVIRRKKRVVVAVEGSGGTRGLKVDDCHHGIAVITTRSRLTGRNSAKDEETSRFGIQSDRRHEHGLPGTAPERGSNDVLIELIGEVVFSREELHGPGRADGVTRMPSGVERDPRHHSLAAGNGDGAVDVQGRGTMGREGVVMAKRKRRRLNRASGVHCGRHSKARGRRPGVRRSRAQTEQRSHDTHHATVHAGLPASSPLQGPAPTTLDRVFFMAALCRDFQ